MANYNGNSIVDYLASVGKPSDYNSRATLAKQMGISNYTGTASQNTQLLNSLQNSSSRTLPTVEQTNQTFQQQNPQYGYNGQPNPTTITPAMNTADVGKVVKQNSGSIIDAIISGQVNPFDIDSYIKSQVLSSYSSAYGGGSGSNQYLNEFNKSGQAQINALKQQLEGKNISYNGQNYNISNGQAIKTTTTVNKTTVNGQGNYTTGTSAQNNDFTTAFNKMTPAQQQAYTTANPNVDTSTGLPKTNAPNGATGDQTGAPQGNTGDNTAVTGPKPTGNKSLDDILNGLHSYITGSLASGFQINPALSIQPSTVAQFLSDTASQLNPQLQQQLTNEITGVNASINTLQKSYEATQGQTVQDYQQSLGTLRDQSSVGGGAERALEMGLTNSANRNLSILDSTAQQKIGDVLRAGGMDVGQGFAGANVNAAGVQANIPGVTGNAYSFNIPSIYGRTLSNQGGDSVFAGSGNVGNKLDFGYNPSTYVKGTLPGQYSTDFFNTLNSTAGNYLQGQAATGNRNILSDYGKTLLN